MTCTELVGCRYLHYLVSQITVATSSTESETNWKVVNFPGTFKKSSSSRDKEEFRVVSGSLAQKFNNVLPV